MPQVRASRKNRYWVVSLLAGLALLPPLHALALERIAPSLATLITDADVIVVGVARCLWRDAAVIL